MKQSLSIIVFSLLLLSACATPTPVAPTAIRESTLSPAPTLTVPPSATITPPPIEPTDTPTPTINPSELPNGSPTPTIPMVLASDKDGTQCHIGPGVEYAPIFTIKAAQIVGKDKTGLWWYIQTYDKQAKPIFCWVDTKNVHAAGKLSTVQVTEAEQASVTAVNISIDGNNVQEITCGQNAAKPEFHFTGEITSNGPVDKLRYQWVTDAGARFSPEQIQIRAWDAPARFEINISTPAQEGTYSLTLRTISPNEMVQVAQFGVKCR